MKRILILLMILALSLLACADPTADSLSVSSVSEDPGATNVLVLVNITNVADGPIQTIMFDVIYDRAVIELVRAGRGHDLPKDDFGDDMWNVLFGTTNKKSIQVATLYKDHALADGTTGNIVKLYFNVIGTAGLTSPIEISNIDISSTGLVHGTISTINNGTFTITGGIPGDLNGDGTITSTDVAIALQIAVCGEYDTLADVNADGCVTALDALMIMRHG